MKYEGKKKRSTKRAKTKASVVTKPVKAVECELPPVTIKKSEPLTEPEPEPACEGFTVIGKWSGIDQCKCNFCGEVILRVASMQRHVYNSHMKPVVVAKTSVESKILDSDGSPIIKTVM